MAKPDLVRITWLDACSPTDTWTPTEQATAKLVRVESVGFVIKRSKVAITIAASVYDGYCGSIITIPKSGIKRIKRL